MTTGARARGMGEAFRPVVKSATATSRSRAQRRPAARAKIQNCPINCRSCALCKIRSLRLHRWWGASWVVHGERGVRMGSGDVGRCPPHLLHLHSLILPRIFKLLDYSVLFRFKQH